MLGNNKLRSMVRFTGLALAAGSFAAAIGASAASADTLDSVRERGKLICGVSQGLPGFSNTDSSGNWSGLDVDYCRAMAAAIFGDPEKVQFTPLSGKERFTALQSGEIDVLSRNTTWTMSRDTQLGINFVGTDYYDGQGMMVRNKEGITSALELDGASICTGTGTTTELNIADYFRSHNMDYELVAFEKADEVIAAYEAGRCDVYTTDASGLYGYRLKLANISEHKILPEIISKEPLGPAVRQGDDRWFNIAKWTLFALVNAEEAGITQANVEDMKSSDNPNVRRLLGLEGEFGDPIGLSNDFVVKIISAVGNYGEIFKRNVGADSPLGIDRGLNKLWSDGGLMYAPPFR